MNWWLISAVITLAASLICALSTAYEISGGKQLKPSDIWGTAFFHGTTAVLGIWLLLKALGKM